MEKWIFCVLFLSACQGSHAPQTIDNQAVKQSSGIVGGVAVPDADPIHHQVFLYATYTHSQEHQDAGSHEKDDDNVSTCTTSALTPRVFLLAAHCIASNSYKSEITFPAADPDDDGITINVVKSIRHEGYSSTNTFSDLALVLLEKDAPPETQIMQIPTPQNPIVFSQIRAAGFGDVSGIDEDDNDGDEVLRTVPLDVTSFQIDQPRFVVDQTHGQGICHGDSGGPAVIQKNNFLYIVGVASETTYDPKKKPLDVCSALGHYVNVQYYYTWIAQHVDELSRIK